MNLEQNGPNGDKEEFAPVTERDMDSIDDALIEEEDIPEKLVYK